MIVLCCKIVNYYNLLSLESYWFISKIYLFYKDFLECDDLRPKSNVIFEFNKMSNGYTIFC